MTALDRQIEAFAAGHAAELDDRETFLLGEAAGIIGRIHSAYLHPTAEQIEQLGRESLRRHHPTLAAEVDAELDAER